MIEEKIFDDFFKAHEDNHLILDRNPIDCSDYETIKWLFQHRIDLEKRIESANCKNGTHLWDLIDDEIIGNVSQEVTTPIHSTITRTTTRPTSVSTTPSTSLSTDSDENDSQSIHQIIKHLEDLINQTKYDDSLHSSEQLKEILSQIQTIQSSLDSMIELDFETALNLTENIHNVLSNLLNQNEAWFQTTATERTAIASDILLQIQSTSFFLTCNQNNLNKTIDRLINDNIIADMYHNFDQQIHFEANDSSILIPKEVIDMNGIEICGNSSFAALISRLNEYLNESLTSDQSINTNVISFSLTNATDIIKLGNGMQIKFR